MTKVGRDPVVASDTSLSDQDKAEVCLWCVAMTTRHAAGWTGRCCGSVCDPLRCVHIIKVERRVLSFCTGWMEGGASAPPRRHVYSPTKHDSSSFHLCINKMKLQAHDQRLSTDATPSRKHGCVLLLHLTWLHGAFCYIILYMFNQTNTSSLDRMTVQTWEETVHVTSADQFYPLSFKKKTKHRQ